MQNSIGQSLQRVDGRAKVTGAATYAAEQKVPNLAYAVMVTSTIAKGRVASVEIATLSAIDRNADLVITWDGNGYAPTETVTVVLSTSPPANTPLPAGSSAAVFCRAAAQAGKLIITRDLLQPIAPTLAGFSSSLYMSVLSDSSRPNLFQVPLKFGGTAPVSVSRASNETIRVVIQ
jgi:hypothetical protein